MKTAVTASIVVAVAAAAVVTGLALRDETPAEPTPTRSPIKVTASALAQAYEQNEVAADHNYKGEPLQVTGTVDEIGTDIAGRPYLQLRSFVGLGVQASFERDAHLLAKLTKGEQVTITCTGAGKIVLVQLRACSMN